MFGRAKLVINDLELAITQFEKKPLDEDFRLTLVLCISLLRCVGNVIENESKINENLRVLNESLFASKKEDRLFKEFIKGFRDTLLKEYKASVGWASIEVYESKDKRVEYLIKDGFYVDRDVRDLLAEGAKWWKSYIEELEMLAKRFNNN